MGLDAMDRLLKRTKKQGARGLGHGYKKSVDVTSADTI